jgi:hypothetical protein
MQHIGTTVNGEALFGQVENGVRCYYLEEELVAVATGNLEEVGFTHYGCLEGVWEPDFQTSIVTRDQLLQIAGKPAVSVA